MATQTTLEYQSAFFCQERLRVPPSKVAGGKKRLAVVRKAQVRVVAFF
jgi:hypothetical protein